MKKIQYFVLLSGLLIAGCSQKEVDETPVSRNIWLGVEGLGSTPASRAALDEWDDTTVGIAYAYAPSTVFDRALTVNVADQNGEHINTGMEYPLGDTEVSFIGYYPATAPSVTGDVTYDLRHGDVDVMMSNKLTGKLSNQITAATPMVFRHQLARFVFEMKCKPGESYPEPVCGVSVSASSFASGSLMTYAMLDLATGTTVFKVPGMVFNGTAEGQPVPQEHGTTAEPLVFDLMVQPGIPLDFKVVTLTETKTITIGSNPTWTAITETTGAEAGKQYTIRLAFSAVSILDQGITVTSWSGKTLNPSDGVLW